MTLAKGIGNGCPLAAVVTTPQIAEVLTQRVHFNTFGGNPVVCAQGRAVLEVIERENLQATRCASGDIILEGLEKLKAKHNLVGDVRGKGLLLGMELVKRPRHQGTGQGRMRALLETCRDLGLLLGKGGLWGRTLRLAPPMCLTLARTRNSCWTSLDTALSTL